MCRTEKLFKDTGVSELILLYNNLSLQSGLLKSFTIKSENTYNQKLAHCVRWHPHLTLSFSRLLHCQPLLVCTVQTWVNWNTPISNQFKKEMMWSFECEAVRSKTKDKWLTNHMDAVNSCASLVGIHGDMWRVTRNTRMEKFSRDMGSKTHWFCLHLSPICHNNMFLDCVSFFYLCHFQFHLFKLTYNFND